MPKGSFVNQTTRTCKIKSEKNNSICHVQQPGITPSTSGKEVIKDCMGHVLDLAQEDIQYICLSGLRIGDRGKTLVMEWDHNGAL